ncbi:hypothetical protein BpHYR1_029736 [Brachionus plicatilis]|uniref:Uncharacterized protein n=1 Tax=Brachionus plicatilis TaxID=10195 RepID=A0A3M7QYD2_BRAPC|nr:hypothetical protein BpHYR1_029736 [Brachionus plicatilis]
MSEQQKNILRNNIFYDVDIILIKKFGNINFCLTYSAQSDFGNLSLKELLQKNMVYFLAVQAHYYDL